MTSLPVSADEYCAIEGVKHSPLIDRGGVGRMLSVPTSKLYRRLPALMRLPNNPFPGPVLGNGSGARWDPVAIDHWIRAGGEFAPVAHPAPAESQLSDAWASRLDDRATHLALEEPVAPEEPVAIEEPTELEEPEI